LTLEQFETNLRESELLGHSQLDSIRTEIDGGLYADPTTLAASLLSRGVLTAWQCEKLLAGIDRGFILGKYKLQRLIANSDMSSVYEAEHLLLHRRVALKILSKELAGDGSFLERFYREAQAVASLDHPNIMRGFDVGQEGDYHYLVMEFIEGTSLQGLVEVGGPLPFDQAAELIRQAALGLGHAHQAGLIHRDIKPANLLLDLEGTVKILDLGLVRSLSHEEDGQAGLTRIHDERVLGTVDYLSPEQAIDSHDVDIRTDIYSLGCTLYFLLVGSPPFSKGTLAERLLAHQTQTAPPISISRPDVPEGLARIVERMLAKKPEERFQNPAEVSTALNDWLLGLRRDSSSIINHEGAPHVRPSRGKERREGLRLPRPATQHAKVAVKVVSPRASLTPSAASNLNSWISDDPKIVPRDFGPTNRPLLECWERWVIVMQALSSPGITRPRIDETTYRRIYYELRQAYRASFADADESTRRILRKIEDLTSPWPTLRSLISILRGEMKHDILMQATEIDLLFQRRSRHNLSTLSLALLLASGAALYLLFSYLS
jgi:serine/threonine protein kinase